VLVERIVLHDAFVERAARGAALGRALIGDRGLHLRRSVGIAGKKRQIQVVLAEPDHVLARRALGLSGARIGRPQGHVPDHTFPARRIFHEKVAHRVLDPGHHRRTQISLHQQKGLPQLAGGVYLLLPPAPGGRPALPQDVVDERQRLLHRSRESPLPAEGLPRRPEALGHRRDAAHVPRHLELATRGGLVVDVGPAPIRPHRLPGRPGEVLDPPQRGRDKGVVAIGACPDPVVQQVGLQARQVRVLGGIGAPCEHRGENTDEARSSGG